MTQAEQTDLSPTPSEASLRVANALKQSLLKEREALGAGDAETLNLAIQAKAVQLRELQYLLKGTAEGQALRAAKSSQQSADGPDHSPWQAFMSLLAECESLNSTNGAAIRLRKQQIDHNLALLRGQSTAPTIYGPLGNAGASQAGRPLTEA